MTERDRFIAQLKLGGGFGKGHRYLIRSFPEYECALVDAGMQAGLRKADGIETTVIWGTDSSGPYVELVEDNKT